MASINPLIDLNLPVDRQDLFDMWGGALTDVGAGEFQDGYVPIVVGSSFSDAPGDGVQPGQMFWHQGDNLMYVWHDEISDTGVSLWLAIGPDRFDTAMITSEEIPAGYGVELQYDRVVRRERTAQMVEDGAPALEPQGALPRCIGFNQSGIDSSVSVNSVLGETAASGAWIRVAVDGIIIAALEDQSSADSPAFHDWSSGEWVNFRGTPGEKPSIIGFTGEPLPMNAIGAAFEAGAAVVGATQYRKIVFAPRVCRQALFRD